MRWTEKTKLITPKACVELSLRVQHEFLSLPCPFTSVVNNNVKLGDLPANTSVLIWRFGLERPAESELKTQHRREALCIFHKSKSDSELYVWRGADLSAGGLEMDISIMRTKRQCSHVNNKCVFTWVSVVVCAEPHVKFFSGCTNQESISLPFRGLDNWNSSSKPRMWDHREYPPLINRPHFD